MMDRFGVRRIMTLALTVSAAAVAMSPAMREAWQLVVLWGVVVGLGTGVIGAYIAAYIAARWFRRRQGLVVGLLTAANAAGQLVFLPNLAEPRHPFRMAGDVAGSGRRRRRIRPARSPFDARSAGATWA